MQIQDPPQPPAHPRGWTGPLITYKWHPHSVLGRPPYLSLKSGGKFESSSRSKEQSTRCCIFGVFGLSELIDWREDQYLFPLWPQLVARMREVSSGVSASADLFNLTPTQRFFSEPISLRRLCLIIKCRRCEKIGAKSVWRTRCVSILVPKHLFASPCAPSKQWIASSVLQRVSFACTLESSVVSAWVG